MTGGALEKPDSARVSSHGLAEPPRVRFSAPPLTLLEQLLEIEHDLSRHQLQDVRDLVDPLLRKLVEKPVQAFSLITHARHLSANFETRPMGSPGGGPTTATGRH